MWHYTKKMLRIYYWNFWQWLNRKFLVTYPLIEDCARCKQCGRNVHDFHVPDELWEKVIGKDVVYCYDCFSDRADKKLGMKWRINLTEKWNHN